MAFYACLPALLSPSCLHFFPSEEDYRRNRDSLKLPLEKEGFLVTIHSFHGAPWIGIAIYLKTGSESGS